VARVTANLLLVAAVILLPTLLCLLVQWIW
jgi:hypothetical protein